jgi:DNA-binding response OmpR family regulator
VNWATLPNMKSDHTILIIEEEVMLRLCIAVEFEAAGWRVLQTATAEEALLLLERHTPTLVFTDIQLGGALTGWEVGKECRRQGVPVIYTSGAVSPQSKKRVKGVYFSKPYEVTAVIAACDRWRSLQ